MIEVEDGVQVLGRSAVLTFEHEDGDGSWWLSFKSTITGDDEEWSVEVPVSELEPLASWMIERAAVARERNPA